MNISTFGARFYGGQIDRLDDAFKNLGHNVNSFLGQPDLIYSNDISNADKAVAKWMDWDKKPKLIINVLDCPDFLQEWKDKIYHEFIGKLGSADKVTCISKYTQSQLKRYFLIDAPVIYNPIKPVYYIPNTPKTIFSLFVGRLGAVNKRAKEILWPLWLNLQSLGPDVLHIVGGEYLGFGVKRGIVSDEELNDIYNHSFFYLVTSKQEGQNLPLIESIMGGCIPIICKDMTTAAEFGIPELFCEPTAAGMYQKIKDVCNNVDYYDSLCARYREEYKDMFTGRAVAQRILDVYKNI